MNPLILYLWVALAVQWLTVLGTLSQVGKEVKVTTGEITARMLMGLASFWFTIQITAELGR